MNGDPGSPGDRKRSVAILVVSVLFLVPIGVLLALFLHESRKGITFVNKEIAGLRYTQAVWPLIMDVLATNGDQLTIARRRWNEIRDAGDANDAEMGTLGARIALGTAMSRADDWPRAAPEIVAAAAALINKIDDGSNLTLDTDLESFYIMDSVTVKLPALAIHSAWLPEVPAQEPLSENDSAQDARENARGVEQFRTSLMAFDRSVDAIARSSGVPHPAIAAARNEIDAAASELLGALRRSSVQGTNPGEAVGLGALDQKLVRAESQYWDVATRRLDRILTSRSSRLRHNEWIKLLIVVALCVAVLLVVGLMAFSANRGIDLLVRLFRRP